MIKILRVGDTHIQISNINDNAKLIKFIFNLAKESKVDAVEFMGDLFHNHAQKRLEVEAFWRGTFQAFEKTNIKTIAMVGNHDQCALKNKNHINSLNVFDTNPELRFITNKPTIINNIGYIPHTPDPEQFINWATDLYSLGATETLCAHQTFVGAKYNNSIFAEDGIDYKRIPQKIIISGHIHKQQQIANKVLYIGTPSWQDLSDANENKGIWLFEHGDDGAVLNKEFISTENVVTKITKFELHEGDEDPELNSNHNNYLELTGSSSWIKQMKAKYKGICHIKSVPTDRKSVSVANISSMPLEEYLFSHFQVTSGILKEDILEFLREVDNG